ncbi:unnamed protein product [Rangifer tarandus platyrhynchus]|uniref:Uncharacterized protein n=2 Tax=Rangifer tarandus platyrhynchus TaxID=3082113 RepID=A0ACB0ET23_RANTA|nr:unnamed protein product [Rangifer tarandus platyrhynchus]CAI9703723.1 unnamed protein product [Rangifer tarandus platyrhynchus]
MVSLGRPPEFSSRRPGSRSISSPARFPTGPLRQRAARAALGLAASPGGAAPLALHPAAETAAGGVSPRNAARGPEASPQPSASARTPT